METASEVARLDARHAAAERRAGRAAALLVVTALVGGLAAWYAAVPLRSLTLAGAIAIVALATVMMSNRCSRRVVMELVSLLGPTPPDSLPISPLQPGERIGRWIVLESTPELVHVTRRAGRRTVVLQRAAMFLAGIALTIASVWILIDHGVFSGQSSLRLPLKATIALAILTPLCPLLSIGALLPVSYQWIAARESGLLTIERVRLIFARDLVDITAEEVAAFETVAAQFSVTTRENRTHALIEHPLSPPPVAKGAPPDPLYAAMTRWRSRRFAASITLALTGSAEFLLKDSQTPSPAPVAVAA